MVKTEGILKETNSGSQRKRQGSRDLRGNELSPHTDAHPERSICAHLDPFNTLAIIFSGLQYPFSFSNAPFSF